jgi:squalene-hopene/tetraprenyl-beta-curcumene cyclase
MRDELDAIVAAAGQSLKDRQHADGHWVFELEADVAITAEYILLQHHLDEIDIEEERAMAGYIRGRQGPHGGWSMFEAGSPDISATVKAYFALKLVGDDPDAPHMRKARALVLGLGGAARVNVFTRIALALYGQVPWRAVPMMPIEMMLLPRWFPFHIEKISYWSRTVVVPLLILMALRPKARNPRGVDIAELFVIPPEEEQDYIMSPPGARLGPAFLALDRVVRRFEPRFPKALRRRAMRNALAFIMPRLNGEDGLGGIFPPWRRPSWRSTRWASRPTTRLWSWPSARYAGSSSRATAPIASPACRRSGTHRSPCTRCWKAGEAPDGRALDRAAAWLLDREITKTRGDWSWKRPELQPSGWAFQYRNDFYPDVDDTAVVAMALHRADPERYEESLKRAAAWIIGMQSREGGWGSFDVDNTHHYLNAIPFADHGALLDPPTLDVTARCVSMLAQLGYGLEHEAVARGVAYIKREQETDGSWYGRWGVNYVYGTWSALCALNAAGVDPQEPVIRKAVSWLESRQQADGGWGEDCTTYWAERRGETAASTASQTSWALLGLMAAGEVDGAAVRRGVAFLKDAPREGARWSEDLWTGVGFPRVFYLKYHGYAAYFPLWALARYGRLTRSNDGRVHAGM